MTPNVGADSVLEQIRSDFHETHEAIHELPFVQNLARGVVTIQEYGTYLGVLHAVHVEYESALARFGFEAPILGRARLVAEDLSRLGRVCVDPTVSASLTSNATLGWMYVLEGSRRGAESLVRRLPATIVNSGATLYLTESARSRESAWKEVLTRLGGTGARNVDAKAIGRGAVALGQRLIGGLISVAGPTPLGPPNSLGAKTQLDASS